MSTKGLKDIDMGFGYSWDKSIQDWKLDATLARRVEHLTEMIITTTKEGN